eukprot:2697350-Prorocentrum_lima.AAC.1
MVRSSICIPPWSPGGLPAARPCYDGPCRGAFARRTELAVSLCAQGLLLSFLSPVAVCFPRA